MKHNNIAIFIPHVGCPHQCSFCNQCTISGNIKAPTVDDVEKILLKAMTEIEDKSATEIAFFGGSFTAINYDYMIDLLTVANKFIGDNKFIGIRISTRPDCITSNILELLKKFNVITIELGAQSMDDTVLNMNNRGHNANQVVMASKLVKQYGFTLVLQMMVGLFGDTADICLNTGVRIAKLKPDAVRIYPTVVLKNTELANKYLCGEFKLIPLVEAIELCSKLLYYFELHNIRVIKLGLHSSQDIEKDMVAGTYHPAFRELCESKIYFDKAKKLLDKCRDNNIYIYVSKNSISKMIGQKKSNVNAFFELGFNVKILPDENLGKYQLRIEKGG